MNIIKFNIDFAQVKYIKNFAYFPFELVYQTKSLKIEKYCFTTWPKLLTHDVFTPEDNIEKYNFYKYIKNNFTQSDLNDVHNILYEKYWMSPVDNKDNCTSCEIKEFNAKIWSNPTIPYLELKGEFKVDIIKIISSYINNNWCEFNSTHGVLSETPKIKIIKAFPLLLRYNNSQEVYTIILNEVIKQLGIKNSNINKQIYTKTKLKNLYDYKKDVRWGFDKTEIVVEIKEKIRLLKDKALKDPIKYGLLGLATYQILHGGKKNV